MGYYQDNCVFELKPEQSDWGEFLARPSAYFRGEQDMPGATYHVGFQTFVKSVDFEEPHFHMAADEYLVFLGANVPDVFDFDAVIEVDIGEDPDRMETLVIDKASVVKIPPYMWHGPIRFRIKKPVIFQQAYFDGTWSKVTRRMKEDGKYEYIYYGDDTGNGNPVLDQLKAGAYNEADYPDFAPDRVRVNTGKYEHLKYELPEMVTYWGDWCAKPQAYMHGDHDFPGSHYHIGFQVFTKSVPMEVPHFHHHADEYLVFVGPHFPDVFDYDATVTMFIGKDPENMERIVVDKPCVIRVPAGTWHCPIYFNIRKPLMFQATWLDGIWHKILRREKEGGGWEYYYEGDNLRRCRLEPDKWCNICGKCFAGLNETAKDNKAYAKPDWAE